MGHVGLSASAPFPAIQEFSTRFQERFGYTPDHNAIKGYIGAWTVRYVTELIGDFDREAFAQQMHGLCLDAATYPGVLMDVCWDDTGEISRESFLVEVVDGEQVITHALAAN
jgi:branched-chain amino acid transport system substrate-binding protein